MLQKSDIAAHHLVVRRTARYVTIGGAEAPRSVWYVLHGYRQLADRFIERFRAIASPARLIVAPEALNRFYLDDDASLRAHGPDSPVGATWMTRHERDAEIADYVAYLDALDRALKLPRGVRRVLLGFSQGSASAARWAMLGRRRVSRLVLWGGIFPIDPPVAEHVRRLRRLAPLIVRGEQDPSLPQDRVDAEIARLEALGIAATMLPRAGGHTIDGAALLELARVVDP